MKNCTVLIFRMHIHGIFYFYCCGPFTLSESENAKATSLLDRSSGIQLLVHIKRWRISKKVFAFVPCK